MWCQVFYSNKSLKTAYLGDEWYILSIRDILFGNVLSVYLPVTQVVIAPMFEAAGWWSTLSQTCGPDFTSTSERKFDYKLHLVEYGNDLSLAHTVLRSQTQYNPKGERQRDINILSLLGRGWQIQHGRGDTKLFSYPQCLWLLVIKSVCFSWTLLNACLHKSYVLYLKERQKSQK